MDQSIVSGPRQDDRNPGCQGSGRRNPDRGSHGSLLGFFGWYLRRARISAILGRGRGVDLLAMAFPRQGHHAIRELGRLGQLFSKHFDARRVSVTRTWRYRRKTRGTRGTSRHLPELFWVDLESIQDLLDHLLVLLVAALMPFYRIRGTLPAARDSFSNENGFASLAAARQNSDAERFQQGDKVPV